MVIPSVRTVVLVRFPFSDLSRSKLRPAVVLADTGRNDWILCQVTSQSYADPKAVEITAGDLTSGLLRKTSYARSGKLFTITAGDLTSGLLRKTSYARSGKLFTANAGIMTKEIGELKPEKLEEIIRAVILLLEENII